jgi:predicted transcriptional regulator
MTSKEEDIGMLEDALTTLKIVFDEYAHEIKDKHDVLFDEYDLTDLKLYIKKVKKEDTEENKNLLKKAQKKYEKICDRLDNLNDRAFELEQEMMFLKNKTKGEENGHDSKIEHNDKAIQTVC